MQSTSPTKNTEEKLYILGIDKISEKELEAQLELELNSNDIIKSIGVILKHMVKDRKTLESIFTTVDQNSSNKNVSDEFINGLHNKNLIDVVYNMFKVTQYTYMDGSLFYSHLSWLCRVTNHLFVKLKELNLIIDDELVVYPVRFNGDNIIFSSNIYANGDDDEKNSY